MQLIYNFCGATIIEWNNDHTEIRLYGNKGEEDTTRDNLFDIVSLLSYLDKEGYVFITPSQINSDRLIYNRKMYNLQKREDGYYDVWTKVGAVKDQPNVSFLIENVVLKERTGLGDALEYYANSTYHVTETLREFVKNKFKTAEQLQFDKTYKQGQNNFWLAFIIGVISIIISIIAIFAN